MTVSAPLDELLTRVLWLTCWPVDRADVRYRVAPLDFRADATPDAKFRIRDSLDSPQVRAHCRYTCKPIKGVCHSV